MVQIHGQEVKKDMRGAARMSQLETCLAMGGNVESWTSGLEFKAEVIPSQVTTRPASTLTSLISSSSSSSSFLSQSLLNELRWFVQKRKLLPFLDRFYLRHRPHLA